MEKSECKTLEEFTREVDQLMEDRLRFILSGVNDWLNFAEAKNGALLAANSALIFSALGLADGKAFVSDWIGYYFYSSLLLASVSGLICLISFLPHIEIPVLKSRSPSDESSNLLFYGDICDHDTSSYVSALCSRYGFALDDVDAFEKELAEQIVVNSRIAVRKYRMFETALWLDVTALVTPLLSIPCLILWKRRRS